MTTVMWFRRDLRLADHPALCAAAGDEDVVGLFVVDPRIWDPAGRARRAWVAASVRSLQEATDGALVVKVGDPAQVVPEVATSVGARTVHVSAETTPGGRDRDARVAAALAEVGVAGQPDGTPYAVAPGSVRSGQGTPYQVFTPFSRGWREHGWDEPLAAPRVEWRRMRNDADATERIAAAAKDAPDGMPEPGEAAALERWRHFLETGLEDYDETRDRPGTDRTSRMSPYLKIGAVHPRQLLADLAGRSGKAVDRYVAELAWREFYADVLWHRPESAWRDLRPLGIPYDDPGADALDAWRTGRTGYPIVDAGMRQLLHEGWMHNRVRMITASFLTKDLHAWWPAGARHFLEHLVDGDLASNNHGWQWVAGTGTDAAPYFRVFNPVSQGLKFDPDGEYVRRWVPELAHLSGGAAHEPWKHDAGYEHDYPRPIVDHAAERKVALDRYAAR
jgi:deoxyribodipyrimidine photo-lyase